MGTIKRIHSILAGVWSYRIVRIGLAVLFIYGGIIKLIDPKAFARTISGYDFVPDFFLPIVAVGLPIIETLAGIGLLLDIRGSLTVIASLVGVFIFVLGYGISLDLNVDCGCFGAEDLDKRAGLIKAFWRDVFLGGLVLPYLYLSRRTRLGPSSAADKISKKVRAKDYISSSDNKKEKTVIERRKSL